MRQLIRTYSITGAHQITVTGYTFTKQDIRLIINETLASNATTDAELVASVLVSSTKKDNVTSVQSGVITLASATANLTVGDELTIEVDIDNVAKQGTDPSVTLTSVDEKIDDFYDTFDADMALLLSLIIGTETETEENSLTEEQINGLRTLQESYSVLADHCQTIVVNNTVLSQELEPGNIYMFTNRTNNLSITLAAPEEGELAIYHLIIESGETAPTLSFPVSIYWPGGDPSIGSDLRLEINILDNNALYILS